MRTFEIVKDSKGREYKKIGETCYKPDTDIRVINVLEKYMNNRRTIRVYYGDTETGKCWNEERDVRGRVGRSTGNIKIPLLVHPLSYGGPALLDNRILKIVDIRSKAVLYQHEKFIQPKVEITKSDLPEYSYNVLIDGGVYGRCKTKREAKLLRTKMS